MGGLAEWVAGVWRAADVSDGIAAAALIVSVWVLMRQRREAGIAHLVVEYENAAQMILVNLGPGPARRVKMRFGDLPGLAVDLDYLAPGQVHRLDPPGARWMQAPPMPRLSWKDCRWRGQDISPDPGRAPASSQVGTPPPHGSLEAAVDALVQRRITEWERTTVPRAVARARTWKASR